MSFRRPSILVLGTGPLADQVDAGLRREGHRVRRLDRLESTVPDKAKILLDSAALDPARTPILILADPPDAPALVAQVLARSREAKGPRRAGRPADGPVGWPSRPRPVQRLILMHPRDPAPSLPAPEPGDPPRIETFAIEDRAARALLRRWPPHLALDPGFGQVPHLLFLGFAPPARALLLQALRLAHHGQGRPWISLVCDHHEAVAAEILAAYPQAPQVAELRFAPLAGLADMLQAGSSLFQPGAIPQPGDILWPGDTFQPGNVTALKSPPPLAPPVSLVVVCNDAPTTEEEIDPGLTLARHVIGLLATSQGVSPPVLLEVGDAEPGGAIDDWDGQIIPISYRREACRASLLLDGAGDELARTIHEHYCDTIAAQGRDLSQEPAGQPWERLATSYRQANRHQADHFWAKLAVTDCRAVPEDLVEAFALSPLEVERLAIVEHDRWAADRHLDGWSFGPVRDNARKLHPQLIPYAALTEAMKDLDRFAVRGLPTLAARLGLGIQRLLILGIHPPGPACPAGKPLRRLAAGLGAALRERYPDRALVLAATLEDARERALVRVLMGASTPAVAASSATVATAGLFLLLPRPLTQLLDGLTDPAEHLERDGLTASPNRQELLDELTTLADRRELDVLTASADQRDLGGLISPADRRDFLDLLARAERRISLRGAAELATWFARRAEIHLVLGGSLPHWGQTLQSPSPQPSPARGEGGRKSAAGPGEAPHLSRGSEGIHWGYPEPRSKKLIQLAPDGSGLSWNFDY